MKRYGKLSSTLTGCRLAPRRPLAHTGDRSTARKMARQKPLLLPIPILLRALVIVLVLWRCHNLWLKITPRLQQGPTEVLRNLPCEIVVAPICFANALSLLARYFTTRSKVESSQLQ